MVFLTLCCAASEKYSWCGISSAWACALWFGFVYGSLWSLQLTGCNGLNHNKKFLSPSLSQGLLIWCRPHLVSHGLRMRAKTAMDPSRVHMQKWSFGVFVLQPVSRRPNIPKHFNTSSEGVRGSKEFLCCKNGDARPRIRGLLQSSDECGRSAAGRAPLFCVQGDCAIFSDAPG